MNTKLIQYIQLAVCSVVLSFAIGCGSSNPDESSIESNESSIELPDGVQLEMVRVPVGLWFGKFEVTQAQWGSVMGGNPSYFKNPDNPVENVSWNDCQEFLKKLNDLPSVKKSGMSFRLPTEEEWELACRAESTGDFCRLADGMEIAEDTLDQAAWFEDNSGGMPHPVGQKKPNAFGLYDMHGNVWEWTSTAVGGNRVGRGGCWHDSALDCGSFPRGEIWPSFRFRHIGFRLCSSGRADTAPNSQKEASQGASPPASRTAAAESILASMVDIPDKDFKMAKTEVTQAQWEAFMGKNPSCFKGENNPVETVSWDDCQEFLSLLNSIPVVKDSGLTFRLPTDKEWEFACRAGATGDYCKLASGTEITKDTLGQVAWFKDNSDNMTHSVGQKKPNAFGLFDMHGNVWEWISTADGEYRGIRGGGWLLSSAELCESSGRYVESPSRRGINIGFRLCASGRADTAPNSQKEASQGASPPASRTAAAESILASMVDIPGKDYKMAKTEVTQAQWEAITGKNPSHFKGENNPVEEVSWDDCQEFLSLLNSIPVVKDSGLTFRLPTDKEWEYACRAGASGDYCKLANGTEITKDTLGKVAWFAANSDGKTHPVGQKKPNAWGLYDMHGNVWEWTSTADGGGRVDRGGSWDGPAGHCGSSFRDRIWPSIRNLNLGFRLCASSRAD